MALQFTYKEHPTPTKYTDVNITIECYEIFIKDWEQSTANDNVTSEGEYYKCKFCNIETVSRSEFYSHILVCPRTGTFGETEKHECPKCHFKTLFPISLKLHMNQCGLNVARDDQQDNGAEILRSLLGGEFQVSEPEIKVEPLLYTCAICQYVTDSESMLILHNDAIHPLLGCDYCSYTTNSSEALDKHKSTDHVEVIDLCTDSDEDSKEKLRKGFIIAEAREEEGSDSEVTSEKIYTKRYFCERCSFKTKHKSKLKLHLEQSHKKAPIIVKLFQCDRCDYKTNLSEGLKQHKLIEHDNAMKILHCVHCEFKTYNRAIFERHNITHQPYFDCVQCSFKTKNLAELNAHKAKVHFESASGDSSDEYECDVCDYKTQNKNSLQVHHKNHTNFQCDECEYTSKSKVDLERHKRRSHSKEFYTCDQCDFKTDCDSTLSLHINVTHTVWFVCDQCDYKTMSLDGLRSHKSTHERNKWLVCHECNFETRSYEKMELHKINVHKKVPKIRVYGCDKCEFRTQGVESLEEHMVKHTSAGIKDCGDSSISKVKIETCAGPSDSCTPEGKSENYTLQSLNESLNSQLSSKVDKLEIQVGRYQCQSCVYQTDYEENLAIHMRTEHAMTPKDFKCDMCPYSTKLNIDMNKHQLQAHGKTKSTAKDSSSTTPSKPISDDHNSQVLANHKSRVHPVDNTYTCTECDFATDAKSFFDTHMAITHISSYECGKCDFKAKSPLGLQHHRRRIHLPLNVSKKTIPTPGNKEISKCKDCGYRSPHKSLFEKHVECHGNRSNPYKCRECNFRAQSLRHLKFHHVIHAKGNAEDSDDESSKEGPPTPRQSSSEDDDNREENNSEKEEDALEDFANFLSKSSSEKVTDRPHKSNPGQTNGTPRNDESKNVSPSLESELAAKIGAFESNRSKQDSSRPASNVSSPSQNYSCDQCPFVAKYGIALNQHKMQAHESSKSDWLKCGKCDFTTKQSGNLIRHKALKHDESTTYNYGCHECEYETNFKSSLKKHRSQHLGGGGKFRCAKCSFKAESELQLKLHEKVHSARGAIDKKAQSETQETRKVGTSRNEETRKAGRPKPEETRKDVRSKNQDSRKVGRPRREQRSKDAEGGSKDQEARKNAEVKHHTKDVQSKNQESRKDGGPKKEQGSKDQEARKDTVKDGQPRKEIQTKNEGLTESVKPKNSRKVSKDKMLVQYKRKLQKENRADDFIKARLKYAICFHSELKKVINVKEYSEIVNPCHTEAIIDVCKNVGGFDIKTGRFKKPLTAKQYYIAIVGIINIFMQDCNEKEKKDAQKILDALKSKVKDAIKKNLDKIGEQLTNQPALREHHRPSDRLKSEIFPSLQAGAAKDVIEKDQLIILYGNNMLGTSNYASASSEHQSVKVRLRSLAKLLIEIKKLKPNVKNLSDVVHRSYCNVVIDGLLAVGKFDENAGKFETPTTAKEALINVRNVTKLFKSNCVSSRKLEADKFLGLLDHKVKGLFVEQGGDEGKSTDDAAKKKTEGKAGRSTPVQTSTERRKRRTEAERGFKAKAESRFKVRKDPGQREFSCGKCPFKAKTRSVFAQHSWDVHKPRGVGKFGCHECEYKCEQRNTLKRHYESFHPSKKVQIEAPKLNLRPSTKLKKIFSRFRYKHDSIQTDTLIISLGNHICEQGIVEDWKIKAKLWHIQRFKLQLRKIKSDVTQLKDVMYPSFSKLIVDTLKAIGGFNEETQVWEHFSNTVMFSYVNEVISFAAKNNINQAKELLATFTDERRELDMTIYRQRRESLMKCQMLGSDNSLVLQPRFNRIKMFRRQVLMELNADITDTIRSNGLLILYGNKYGVEDFEQTKNDLIMLSKFFLEFKNVVPCVELYSDIMKSSQCDNIINVINKSCVKESDDFITLVLCLKNVMRLFIKNCIESRKDDANELLKMFKNKLAHIDLIKVEVDKVEEVEMNLYSGH